MEDGINIPNDYRYHSNDCLGTNKEMSYSESTGELNLSLPYYFISCDVKEYDERRQALIRTFSQLLMRHQAIKGCLFKSSSSSGYSVVFSPG